MTQTDIEAWQDPDRPAGERIADLLSQMTLEEKIAQLGSVWMGASGDGDGVAPMQDQFFRLDAPPFEEQVKNGLGQLTRVFGTRPVSAAAGMSALAALQERVMAASRLAIPAVAHEECLTGFAAWGATIYPTPLAWGAAFDPGLVGEMTEAFGATMRAVGVHQGLAPVLDVTRDYRWGRTEETIGEDPYLVGTIGTAYVRGLQRSGDPGHAQALRRLRRLPGRAEHGPGLPGASRARRHHCGPVRDGHQAGRRALGDAGLRRGRRDPRQRRRLAADHAAARASTASTAWSCPTTTRSRSWSCSTPSRPAPATRRRSRSPPASTSSCPPPGASASRWPPWPRPAPCPGRSSTGPRPGCCGRSSTSACSTPAGRPGPARRTRRPDLDPPAQRDIARRLAEESVILLANDGGRAAAGAGRPGRRGRAARRRAAGVLRLLLDAQAPRARDGGSTGRAAGPASRSPPCSTRCARTASRSPGTRPAVTCARWTSPGSPPR